MTRIFLGSLYRNVRGGMVAEYAIVVSFTLIGVLGAQHYVGRKIERHYTAVAASLGLRGLR